MDPFDLVRQLTKIPTESLVDKLADLAAKEGTLSTQRHPDGWARDVADQLQKIYEGGLGRWMPLPEVTRPYDPGGVYELARRYFGVRETRLRDERWITDRLLDGLGETPVHAKAQRRPLQEELRLQGPGTGRLSGRFRVRNELDEPSHVRFEPGVLRNVESRDRIDASFAFTPDVLLLAVGEAKDVTLDLHLPAGVFRLEGHVDVVADEQVLLKLWLNVETRSERS